MPFFEIVNFLVELTRKKFLQNVWHEISSSKNLIGSVFVTCFTDFLMNIPENLKRSSPNFAQNLSKFK